MKLIAAIYQEGRLNISYQEFKVKHLIFVMFMVVLDSVLFKLLLTPSSRVIPISEQLDCGV